MTNGNRWTLAGAIAIGMGGCGGGTESSVDADPGFVDGDPGFVDSTSPADGDTGVALLTDVLFTLANLSAREILHNGPGADGVWLTADDVVYIATDRQYETSGVLALESRFDSVGPDAEPFTDDDVLGRQYFYDTSF